MTLATLTGLMLFGAVLTFISIGIIGGLATLGKHQPAIPTSAVLTMDMSTIALAEQATEMDPLTILQGGNMEIQPVSVGKLDQPAQPGRYQQNAALPDAETQL